MNNIRIATAQFEHRNGDKAYNLSVIDSISKKAAAEGAQVIAFHECSISAYTFARNLSEQQMLALAEYVPGGESIEQLTAIARSKAICHEGRRRSRARPTPTATSKVTHAHFTRA